MKQETHVGHVVISHDWLAIADTPRERRDQFQATWRSASAAERAAMATRSRTARYRCGWPALDD